MDSSANPTIPTGGWAPCYHRITKEYSLANMRKAIAGGVPGDGDH